MSDEVGAILAGIGDAADILTPPDGFAEWIAAHRETGTPIEQPAEVRDAHTYADGGGLHEYSLDDILEGGA
jgi:hypothetical protein